MPLPTLKKLFLCGLLATSGTHLLANESEEVVTVYRLPMFIEDVSPSVSLFQKEDWENSQEQRVVDLLQNDTGAFIGETGQFGSVSSYFNRGTNSDHTIFLFNGRRLNPGFSGLYSLSQWSLSSLDSVEVQRGASSFLYGSEGIGGSVQLRTDPRTDQEAGSYAGELKSEMGSYGYWQKGLHLRGATDGLCVKGSLTHTSTENQLPNSDFDSTSGQLSLLKEVTEKVSLEFFSIYNDSSLAFPDNTKSFSFPALDNFQNETSYLWSPGVKYAISEDWNLSAFFSRSENRVIVDDSFSDAIDYRSAQNEWDVQLIGEIGEKWSALWGINYQASEFDAKDVLSENPTVDESAYATAAYTYHSYQLTKEFTLGGALRVDNYSDYDTPVTWNVNASYDLPRWRTQVFGSFSKAYATPQAFDIYGTFGNPDLNAEESTSWEIGFKQQLTPSVETSIVYYQTDIDNFIQFNPASFLAENIGDVRIQGVDTKITWTINKKTTLTASLSYLEARDQSTDEKLLRRPDWSYHLNLEHRFHEKWLLGTALTGVLDREDIDGGTFARIDEEDYHVLRFYASYQASQSLEIFARLENALNEQYEIVDGYPALDQAIYAGMRWKF